MSTCTADDRPDQRTEDGKQDSQCLPHTLSLTLTHTLARHSYADGLDKLIRLSATSVMLRPLNFRLCCEVQESEKSLAWAHGRSSPEASRTETKSKSCILPELESWQPPDEWPDLILPLVRQSMRKALLRHTGHGSLRWQGKSTGAHQNLNSGSRLTNGRNSSCPLDGSVGPSSSGST